MADFEGLGEDLALIRAREKARVGKVAPPEAIIANLQNIPYLPGDEVVDSVTGLSGVILGGGIENVASEGA
jgi:hypothetical protein